MKRIILSTIVALTLGGCATSQSAYGPADSYSDVGFRQTKIQQDRFRVSYTGRSLEEARDYVLLRAAELTLNEGYSHFKIVNGGSSHNGSSNIGSHVGVGIGNGGYRGSRSRVNVGLGVHDVVRAVEGQKATENIEIIMQSSGGTAPDIYDAKSVAGSIKPKVFK